VTERVWAGYFAAAETIAVEVMAGPSKPRFLSCDPASEPCLTDTIKAFGRKAFRRPLTDEEVTRFMRLDALTPKGTPAEVAEAILRAFLASPSFIMLPELGPEKEGSAIKLTSYEVATRLSFLLWDSIPDDTLNAEADAGRLTTRDQIRAQARRMLTSDKATAVVKNFQRSYLDIRPGTYWLANGPHDAVKYPNYSPAANAPLIEEMNAFFADLVLKSGGSFKDLFLSNIAFVTRDTAALYGLDPAKYTTELARVELDANRRPGFLTRAGFLSAFSHPDATAPSLRGGFIAQRILGLGVGPPDPDVGHMPRPLGNYTTRRQQMEALTADEPCKTCHAVYIDPPGFVLERYDAVGGWQDTDPLGGPIDGTANVRLSATLTKTITSPLQLMTEIANLREAQRHFAEEFVAYATGRVPNPLDACTVDRLTDNMAAQHYTIADLIADYTQADSFRLRTVGN
jgi:hypothetical protein